MQKQASRGATEGVVLSNSLVKDGRPFKKMG
jgi:hypothetical protein